MGIVLWTAILIFTLFSRFKEKNSINPMFLFNVFWLGIISLTILNLYNFRAIDSLVYKMILLGTIAFNLGCLIPRINITGLSNNANYAINKNYFQALYFMAIAFLAVVDSSAIAAILRGASISSLRFTLRDTVFSSYYMSLLFKFIVYPVVIAYVVYFIASVLVYKNVNRTELVKSIIITIMDFVANGDRIVIYIWFIGIFIVAFTLKKDYVNTLAYRKIKKVGMVIILLAALIMLGRKNMSFSLISSVITYFTGGLVYLTRTLDRINLTAGQTVLVTSYQGFFRPVMGVLELVGVKWNAFETATEFLLTNQTNSFALDYEATRYFNYFTTCFGYFYYDFKMIGVFVHSLVFGLLSKQAYYRFKRNNVRNVGIYMFWVICIFLGMMNFAMAETSISLGLVYFVIGFVRQDIKSIDKNNVVEE